MKRGERKAACKWGHSLTDPANVRYSAKGSRICLACRRRRENEYRDLGQRATKNNARWSDDELAVVTSSATVREIALQLGRSVGAVATMRKRLAGGWTPQGEPPLSEDEIDFIRSTANMTAQQVAEELGRPYSTVTFTRRRLIREEGRYFGKGPYDKDPLMVGDRFLVAKSCIRCGVIRGGAEFSKTSAKCRYCRIELRDYAAEAKSRAALDQRVRELAEMVGVPYRSRHFDEYAKADIELMERSDLTLCEKAARLGRTYDATSMAMHEFGISRRRSERPEPRGVWTIHFPPDEREAAS